MEPLKDAISLRVSRLNDQLLNKPTEKKEKPKLLTRDGLLDALQILYDECNTDCLKINDKNICSFVDTYRKTLIELKQLRVNLSDFEIKNVIGRGHFGDVHVVKERQTGDIYAMKTVRKYEGSVDKCAAYEEERNIMAQAVSPWITKLQYSFQDNSNLYFVMEYHPGGDLLGLLDRQGGTLPESAATFYIAELVVAINDLHQMGFVHRDVKPDNILLDRCGHLKLADFGSAANLTPQGTIAVGGMPVGTPDYIAPEALQSLENKNQKNTGTYGTPCDYWSLGVLAYELTIGSTPFTGQNTTTTYSRIINYTKSLKFPPDVLLTQAFVSFIKQLLTDSNSRLSYTQILKHPLFKTIDFTSLRDQVPPFVPKISSLDDTSNFTDVQVKRKMPNIENFKTKTQFSGKNLPFIGFTYTTEPADYKDAYKATAIVKQEIVEDLKKEVESLERKLLKCQDGLQERDSLERKLDEKCRKLESVESVRDRLEKSLANSIAECQALKRTLDMEKKDRSDLERKALELIKSAKFKWEAAEKLKLDNLGREIDECKEKNQSLTDEINKLNAQLQEALKVSNKHKASVENVEKLRRSSVTALESRLEKVTSETQHKISNLQHVLTMENQKKNDLGKRLIEIESDNERLADDLEASVKHFDEIMGKNREYESTIKELKESLKEMSKKDELLEQYKEVIVKLEDELEDARKDDELARHKESNAVLKKQIKDLKVELNSLVASKLSITEDMKNKHEAQVKELEMKLKDLREEKDELNLKYREANLSLKSKEEKTDKLEQLLNRLQEDLSKLENGSEREGVLQEQIERLEHQLVEVSENAAVEKQEHVVLKSKYWRLEKDITNAELDKKIVERDLKEQQQKVKELMEEITSLREALENTKKSSESASNELGETNQNLNLEISKLREDIKQLNLKLDSEKLKVVNRNKMKEELEQTVEKKELQICQVLETLDEVKRQKVEMEKRIGTTVLEKDKLQKKALIVEKERDEFKNDVEKRKNELQNAQLNYEALKEACVILENQLVEFETVLDCSEQKRRQLEIEIQTLNKTLVVQKTEVQSARKAANEEKSLRLFAETKCKRLADDLENLQQEADSYRCEASEFKQCSTDLSSELTEAEQKISRYETQITSLERQVGEYVAENNFLKEENSEQLTFINNLKESNYKLGQSVNDFKTTVKALFGKISELESLLSEKTRYFKERELKSEATIQQQTKLIDFLQSKVEDGNKKKKTLSDKLFGVSKKENVPPMSVALNYKDLETQLSKERAEKKKLQEEIIKLKYDLHKTTEDEIKRDIVKCVGMQDEILSQIVQSPASQKNDLYRQNSVQRMHHNIPHRFETKLCTKPVKCAQCSNQILLGRNTSVCRECCIITHPNCASSLPRTCGLPTAFAKHYSDSLSKLNSAENECKSRSPSPKSKEEINIEGWVKIPLNNGWEKHYACLTTSALNIYGEPPNNDSLEPIQTLKLHQQNEHGKVVLEPLASEIEIPVANSDLPFVIKVETSPNSTCWPSQCIIFMTLSVEDKEKWFKGLYSIFHTDKYTGDLIYQNPDELEINCLVELTKDIRVIGTESGLYALQKNRAVHISGPLQVYEILPIPAIHTVLMIVDECRVLISCDLNHLISLSQCAPITKPALKSNCLKVNNLDGFHIMKASDFVKHKNVCVATPKQLVILRYDFNRKEFNVTRTLDTAEPVSCVLFTEHSLIIGADKFFEVDLNTFEADEFLDASDVKLNHAVKCYSIKSFPIAILHISKSPAPTEYLVCFNEFATFVDEYGRSTRNADITWTHLPIAFYYHGKYLYVVQFNAVEMFKITDSTCNQGSLNLHSMRVELSGIRYLGNSSQGVYLLAGKHIRCLSALILDDDASSIATESAADDDGASRSDRFSFTSSMMRSLDGNSESDNEATENIYVNKKVVKFAHTTCL